MVEVFGVVAGITYKAFSAIVLSTLRDSMTIHCKQFAIRLAFALVLAQVISWGQTVERGIDEALLAKATAGDPEAQTKIGISYETGQGAPKDYAQAVAWYRKAADQGFARAQYILGNCYSHGEGMPVDYVQSAAWYQKAAVQNDKEAQLDLGLLYASGRGVPKDTKKAFDLFYQAAQLGESDAQYRVAVAYADGHDVPQDLKLAADWYRKSADQGFAGAQFNYAMMRIQEKDYKGGYFWISLAADTLKGEPLKKTIEVRDLCAAQLNGSDLKKANEQISKWKAAHPGPHY
jgi:TPR repeat protein